MNREQVTAIVEEALTRLIASHPTLLDLDVSERAVSHHLAQYISQLVPNDLDVDVEYNRHGADPKRLDLPQRKALDRELRATTVFPDIIVHRRNTDEHNILVLEVKKTGEHLKYDALKLRAFQEELGYRHAAHVIIGRLDDTFVRRVIWVSEQ